MKTIYRVFLAEDSEEIRTLVVRILGRCGIQVVAFEDGRACLNALEGACRFPRCPNATFECCTLPDLVITDIHMPVMNGHELVKAIRTDDRFKHLPILIHSSEAEVGNYVYDEVECAYNIRKPASPKEFRAYVELLLGKGPGSAPGQGAVVASAAL